MNISSISTLAAAAAAEAIPAQPIADDRRTLVHAVKAVNATELFGDDRELAYSIDRNLGRAVVRIVDRKTREVLQQIPAEYVLRLAEELKRS